MKDVPFEQAKIFCKKYQKDQCIILSWDKTSGNTWVTTYGIGDENSIQASEAGRILKDYLKLKRENEEIPTRFEEWNIEKTDRYKFFSGKHTITYVETTYWYEIHSLKRKETTRTKLIYTGEEYKLPGWAKGITECRRELESNHNDL